MIFRQWQQVLDGTKTQTRRLVKEGDQMLFLKVLDKIGRLRWEIDRIYAVQPGRGKKAVGRIRITRIRRERLHIISQEDIFAEGVGIEVDRRLYPITVLDVAIEQFVRLWDSIYDKMPGCSWADNPEVWVLKFEMIGGGERI